VVGDAGPRAWWRWLRGPHGRGCMAMEAWRCGGCLCVCCEAWLWEVDTTVGCGRGGAVLPVCNRSNLFHKPLANAGERPATGAIDGEEKGTSIVEGHHPPPAPCPSPTSPCPLSPACPSCPRLAPLILCLSILPNKKIQGTAAPGASGPVGERSET